MKARTLYLYTQTLVIANDKISDAYKLHPFSSNCNVKMQKATEKFIVKIVLFYGIYALN